MRHRARNCAITDTIYSQLHIAILDLDVKIAVSSAELRSRYRDLPTADSVVAATLLEYGIGTVVSDDERSKRISEYVRNGSNGKHYLTLSVCNIPFSLSVVLEKSNAFGFSSITQLFL